VSDSVRKALGNGQLDSSLAGILGGTPGEKGPGNAMHRGPGGARVAQPVRKAGTQYLADLAPSLEFLSQELKPEIDAGKLQLQLGPRGLVVSLKEAAYFATGEDVISPAGYPSIGKIAESLKKLPNPVRLEGHTDSAPIHNARFRSNWELSVSRGVAMLNLLTERFGVPVQQLSIAGYADNQPLDTNETVAGRARNRRVDIVILNKVGYGLEPGSDTQPGVPLGAHPTH
jgi:chemotaxis protein MotB